MQQVYRITKEGLINEVANVFSKITIGLPNVDVNVSAGFGNNEDIAKGVLKSLEQSGSLKSEDLIPVGQVDKVMIMKLLSDGYKLRAELERIQGSIDDSITNAMEQVTEAKEDAVSTMEEAVSYTESARDELEYMDSFRAEEIPQIGKFDGWLGELETIGKSIGVTEEQQNEIVNNS